MGPKPGVQKGIFGPQKWYFLVFLGLGSVEGREVARLIQPNGLGSDRIQINNVASRKTPWGLVSRQVVSEDPNLTPRIPY